MSDEDFSVDGTLIDAWASMKSVQRKDVGGGGVASGNAEVDFKGQRRSNDTHASTTDPEAKLARKGGGKESRLAYAAHALMENRNGLMLGLCVSAPHDNAEVKAACALLAEQQRQGIEPDSLGADKGYCQHGFVQWLRRRRIKPHIAKIKDRRGPGVDGPTAGSGGLCDFAAHTQAHRGRLRLAAHDRRHQEGQGAWPREGRNDLRAGRLCAEPTGDQGSSTFRDQAAARAQ